MSFTAFAIDDFSQYFKNPEDYPEILEAYDYTDYEKVFRDTFGEMPKKYLLYVCADCALSSYDSGFMTGGDDLFSIYCVDLTDVKTDLSEYSLISTTPATIYKATYHLSDRKFYFDDNFAVADDLTYFKYFSETAHFEFKATPYIHTGSLATQSSIDVYSFFIYTNHPDIHLPDFAGGSSGGALNVSVNFDPEMSGDFQRREIINDKIVTIDTLNFSVTNNSKFSIQYLVAIVGQNDEFYIAPENLGFSHPNGRTYSGNPSYVYVSDEWIYLPSGSSKQSITSTYAPSSWHYVDKGDTDTVTVRFNQMKLDIGVIYNVYVYAIKNTNDGVCVIGTNHDSWQYNQDYVLNFAEAQVVYNSEFTCSNPAEFDSNSNDGSYAYDGDTSLFNRANGYIDENGNVVIDRIDTDSLISGSDSWGSKYDSNAWDVYYSKQNSVSSDLNQLSNNFSSFFRFVNKTFGYFPKNYQSVISLGLTSLVVLGIIKVVVK